MREVRGDGFESLAAQFIAVSATARLQGFVEGMSAASTIQIKSGFPLFLR